MGVGGWQSQDIRSFQQNPSGCILKTHFSDIKYKGQKVCNMAYYASYYASNARGSNIKDSMSGQK